MRLKLGNFYLDNKVLALGFLLTLGALNTGVSEVHGSEVYGYSRGFSVDSYYLCIPLSMSIKLSNQF